MKNKIIRKKQHRKISRKEAIKKTGIAALTASSIIFLDTQNESGTSYKMPTRPGRH